MDSVEKSTKKWLKIRTRDKKIRIFEAFICGGLFLLAWFNLMVTFALLGIIGFVTLILMGVELVQIMIEHRRKKKR